MGVNLGSAQGQVLIDVTQALASLAALNGALASSSGAGGQAFAGATKGASAATNAMTGLGAVLGIVFAGSIKQAADLEFRLSALQSITGSTDEQMVGLKNTILDVAQASVFTTQAVADTAQELALLGVSAENISSGALKAVADLSAATETAPKTAAGVIAAAMNQYGLAGDQVEAVADVFTRASNQSAADVTSIGEGFTYAAGTAHQLGVSWQDLVATLEVLNDQGLQGTMAGTSLNQALSSVINPSKEAATAMDKYGISVKDAAGNFIGVPALIDELRVALATLPGNVDQGALLDTIFGKRGGRAIAALLQAETAEVAAAGKSWEDYREGLDEGATASEQAAQRMDNLRGSLEKMKGALSTIAVQLGGQFLSGLKALVDGLTALAQAVGKLPDVFYEVAAAIGAPLAIFGSLRFISTLAGKSIFRMIPGFQGLANAALRLAGPLAIAVALIEAISLVHKFNLFGLGDQMDNLADHVKQAAKIIKPAWDLLTALWDTPFGDNQTFTTQIKDLNAFTVAGQKLGLSFNTIRTLREGFTNLALPIRRVRNLFTDARKSAGLMFDVFSGNGGQKQLDELKTRLQRLFGPEVGRSLFQATRRLRAGLKRFGDAIGEEFGIKNPFENLSPTALLKSFPKLGKAANKLVSDFKKNVMPVIGQGLDFAFRKAAGGLTFLAEHMDQVGTVVRSLLNLAFRPLLTALDVLKNLLQGDLRGAWDALVSGVESFGQSLLDLGGVALDIFQGIDWKGLLDGVLDSLLDATGAPTWALLWDAIKFYIQNSVPEALDLAKDIALDFAVHVGEIIWGGAKDLAGMIAQFLTGGPNDPAGTGGPNGTSPAANVLNVTVDILATIGRILWDGAIGLGSALYNLSKEGAQLIVPVVADVAVTIGGVLWDQVVGIGGAISKIAASAAKPLISTVADFAVDIAGVLWDQTTDVASALAKFVSGAARPTLNAVVDLAVDIGGVLWDGVAGLAGAIAKFASNVGRPTLNAVVDIAATIGGILWDGIAGLGGAIAKAATNLGRVTIPAIVDVAVTIAGILWDQTTDLASAISKNAGGAVHTALTAVADVAVDIGTIIYGGFLVASAWIRHEVGEVSVAGIEAAFQWLAVWQGVTWGGYGSPGAWIKAQVGPVSTTLDANFKINPGADVNRESQAQGRGIGKSIAENLTTGLTAGFNSIFGRGGGEGGDNGGGVAGQVGTAIALPFAIVNRITAYVAGIVIGIGEVLAKNFAKNMVTLANPFTSLPGQIITWLTDSLSNSTFGPNGSQDPARGFVEGQSGLSQIGDFLATTLIGDVVKLAQSVLTSIADALSNVSVSDLGDVVGKVKDAVFGLIGKAIDAALGGIDAGVASNPDTHMFANIGGSKKGLDGLGAGGGMDGLASSIVEGVGDAIVAALQNKGAALDAITAKIKEAVKGLVDDVIDKLPIPGIVKNALKNIGDLFDGIDNELSAALKDQGGKNIKNFRDFLEAPPPTSGPTPNDFLSQYALDKNSINTIIDKAKENVGKLKAGLLAAAQSARDIDISPPRPKLPELDTGRAKLPELQTQTAVKVPPADLSAYQASVARIPVILAFGIATAIQVAAAGVGQIGVVVGTGIGTMVGNVAALMTGLTNAVGQGMSDALAVAVVYANAIYVQVSEAIGTMVGNVLALVGFMAAGIASALDGAASSAYASGVAIGAGLAAGMNSQTAAVSAAAAGLAAAASAATSAALKEASPSRVFFDKGVNTALGFIGGMVSKYRDVAAAAGGLARSAIPSSTMTAQTAAAAAQAGAASVGNTQTTTTEQNNYNLAISPDMSRMGVIQDVVNVVNGLKRSIEIATAGGTVRTIV